VIELNRRRRRGTVAMRVRRGGKGSRVAAAAAARATMAAKP
jgi:hypothetical protein